ncbi:uncharacterized protein Dwil_GK17415 [Drosophila willistoni]|uniref:Uncharacterized protein n=1 Tax=Drosophila willistoni TaxID=7260 RepID=B4MLX4_DROWI|nr:uncharacterized protein LOC6638917 [Drosophila willistoni]EDW73185.1 uncharacterized protein Dwil_GK17415 [Drosophila willistoni]
MEEPNRIIKTDLPDCEEKDEPVSKDSEVLTKHIKRRVLTQLEKFGTTPHTLKIAAAHRRGDNTNSIIDYIISSANKAEECVDQECNSVSLNNINQWLELMKNMELTQFCEHEAGVVMNAIVRNEPQSKPEELNGINMTEVYKFLENALIGQPQKALSEPSQSFLFREIALLIAEANSDQSDVEARKMGQNLYNCQDYNYVDQPHKASLDPLFLDKS